VVSAYAANTHNGIIRPYNEDRISIVLDMKKNHGTPKAQPLVDKKVSFFAIFDGHGGAGCPDFLRDHLHQFVSQSEHFPHKPEQALKEGCNKAEDEFMRQNLNILKDKSGSCAIIVMIVDQMCYIANVGDSRALMAMNHGTQFLSLSTDHKPEHPSETQRILSNGGQIYRHTQPGLGPVGPKRVLPGRLSVSRTFGDAMAKIEQYGGRQGVVVAEPEISSFQINPNKHDFILLGCDGIFDKLETEDAGQALFDHSPQEK